MLKKWLLDIDDIISVASLTGVIGVTIANVIGRFLFNSPIAWGEEVSLGLFVWLVFVGCSSAMKRDGHIGVDYFVRKMPPWLGSLCEILRAAAIYYVLIALLVVLGWELTAQAGEKITPALGISYQLIDIAVPLGGILAAVQFTRRLMATRPWQHSKGGDR